MTEKIDRDFDKIDDIFDTLDPNTRYELDRLDKYLDILVDSNQNISEDENMKFFKNLKGVPILNQVENVIKNAETLLIPFVDSKKDTEQLFEKFRHECVPILIEIENLIEKKYPLGKDSIFANQLLSKDELEATTEEENKKRISFENNRKEEIDVLERSLETQPSLIQIRKVTGKALHCLDKTTEFLNKQAPKNNYKPVRKGVHKFHKFSTYIMTAVTGLLAFHFTDPGGRISETEKWVTSIVKDAKTDIPQMTAGQSTGDVDESSATTSFEEAAKNMDKHSSKKPKPQSDKEEKTTISTLNKSHKKNLTKFLAQNFKYGTPTWYTENGELRFDTEKITDSDSFEENFEMDIKASEKHTLVSEQSVFKFCNRYKKELKILQLKSETKAKLKEQDIEFVKFDNNNDAIIKIKSGQGLDILRQTFESVDVNQDTWTTLNKTNANESGFPQAGESYKIPGEIFGLSPNHR